jgi:hypothetical protein
MELGSCITGIIHRDNTLTNIIMTPYCLTSCYRYALIESSGIIDDFFGTGNNTINDATVEADENSVSRDIIHNLNSQRSGSKEWFDVFGGMIAKLPNLKQLTFDGVDPDAPELEGFWAEISASQSLTSLKFANMNLESCHDILGGTINALNLRSVVFRDCIIHHEIGHVLHDVLTHDSLTTLHFDECRFSNTNTLNLSMREIVDFAGYLAVLTSITSLEFTSCALDAEQSMCLVRSLREERVKLGLGLVQINCTI